MDTRLLDYNRKMMALLWLLLPLLLATVTADLCDVTNGQSAIILDLPESIGEKFNQRTSPEELPLEGSPGTEVEVTLAGDGVNFFTLEGKTLHLRGPLDRDEHNLFSIRFSVMCRVLGSGRQRSAPVVVRVVDRNDNVPSFVGGPYSVTLPESTPVGSTVFSDIKATDADAGTNGQVRYEVVPGNGGITDGYGTLTIDLPHQGHVTVARELDYETSRVLIVNVQASDNSPTNQQTSITTLTVLLTDSDDQDPVFVVAGCNATCPAPAYTATVVADRRVGVMDVKPERIHAVDQDSLGSSVRYTLESGEPTSYRRFFRLDPYSGALSQIAPVPRGLTHQFVLALKVTEETSRRGSVRTTLTIVVENPDSSMPVVRASAAIGAVIENSVPGTPVLDGAGAPITFIVTDPDLLPGEVAPGYVFELTTGAFRVSGTGALEVAIPGLDRDPPSPHTHTFQVVAREVSNGPADSSAASAPITVTVELLDANDHAPRFPVYPPLVLPAGSRHVTLTTLRAVDPDAGSYGALQYELTSVTGSGPAGRAKFRVDAQSGEVRLVGNVVAKEIYRLHVTASDGGGLTGSVVLEVVVDKGPNTGGPYFQRREFSTIIPEDTLPGTAVIKLTAVDPDGDVPRYSLHAMHPSGGLNGARGQDKDRPEVLPFQVDPLSGEVTLSMAVDREKKDSYTMVITAEDDEGLRGSVTLSVRIADVNDRRPVFLDAPYSFRVEEGRQGALLGIVTATDDDADRSGLVEYSVPELSPVSVGPYNGTVYTRVALDYEKQQVHYIVLTAKDNGRPPLSSTTTLTLLIGDVSDEPPLFTTTTYATHMSEGAAIGSLVTTVEATDPDSNPSVTYTMKSVGREARMFAVHADTGRVTITAPLDREMVEEHVLVIGTLENTGEEKGATCTVIVSVVDENDATPVLRPLPPLLVSLDAAPDAVLATAHATDDDATAPNNKVMYELIMDDVIAGYLSMESTTGEITLVKKFEDLNITEFKAEVVARDGGTPPRSSSTPLLILVEVEGAPPPRIVVPPTFSRSQVYVSIKEDTLVGGMIARVGIINPPLHPVCKLKEESAYFRALLTESGDCAVQLSAPVDADTTNDVNTVVTLLLVTPLKPGYQEQQQQQATATINITVEDVNDNAPMFHLIDSEGENGNGDSTTDTVADDTAGLTLVKRQGESMITLGEKTLLLTVSDDTTVGQVIAELTATDQDSGSNGVVRYTLVPKSNRGGYFSIDPITGVLTTTRELLDVPLDLNPFNLTVVAQDRPMEANHNTDTIQVVVNVVTPAHRIVIAVRAPHDHVTQQRQLVIAALRDRHDEVIILERIAASAGEDGGRGGPTMDAGLGGTSEVWLAMLDPYTGRLLPRAHPRVNRVMSQPSDEPSSLRYSILAAIGERALLRPVTGRGAAPPEHSPKGPHYHHPVFGGTTLSDGGPESILASLPGLQLGLVVLAVAILVVALLAILYICVHWARVTRRREKCSSLPIIRVPIMAAPLAPSITDTLHKQYEVQVLSMSVPLDDDSVKDVTPPRSAHNFFMDNVSYISKNNLMTDNSRSDSEHQGMDDPSHWDSGPSTSRFASNEGFATENSQHLPGTNQFEQRSSQFTPGVNQFPPGSNQSYPHRRDSDSDDLEHNDVTGELSHSATNHNVMFGRRNMSSPGIGNSSANHNAHLEGYNSFNDDGGSPGGIDGSRGGVGAGRRGNFNNGYDDDGEDDEIGYGFSGAGLGGAINPILDLSPVQTTTLL